MSIVALYDTTGYSVFDWAAAGQTCYCLDIQNDSNRRIDFPSGGSVSFLFWDATTPQAKQQVLDLFPQIIIGFPPCTDLAVSGAKHFEKKREKDAKFFAKAIELVLMVPEIAQAAGCDWLWENPIGMISSWKKPDVIFDPADFGGYLPENDIHPEWPEFIEPRDGYNKRTCIWKSSGIIWPAKKPVPAMIYVNEAGQIFNRQTQKLGGKSEKTKNIRSATPRGFARALFEANFQKVTGIRLEFSNDKES